ncbi:MAG: hypothetical protein LBE33_06240 [Zoogloeaceae bacterium]|jgi:hypothetical protein|nr:hypothetical protein [Zoogloeaceae bacterium]
MKQATITLLLCLCAVGAAGTVSAASAPCGGSKGGISRCEGEKFICNDGSVSASKKKCSTAEYGAEEKPSPAKKKAARNGGNNGGKKAKKKKSSS